MKHQFVAPRVESTGAPDFLLRRLTPQVPTHRVLDADICRELADIVLDAHERGQSWSSRTRYAGGAQWDVNGEFRRSKNLPANLPGLARAYDALQAQAIASLPSMGLDPELHRLTTVDEQCLVYLEGDHIGDHADDSALIPSDDGEAQWQAIKPQRHLVGIVWLTSQSAHGDGRYEFAGGALRFNSLVHHVTHEPLDVQPSAGTMVVFPSNPWFRHQVLPVLSGTRIALTRWWQITAVDAAARDLH